MNMTSIRSVKVMPTSKDKKVFHLVSDKDNFEKYNKMYPNTMRIFLNNALYLATNNKDFFEKVFFKDIDEKIKTWNKEL